jgi:4-carboxymuconolactone decarboxylase
LVAEIGAEDNFRDERTSDERRADGRKRWREVMVSEPPPDVTAYQASGILDFVFGVVWNRPQLSRRDRRWITLTAVGAADTLAPIESHVRAAMLSGDCSYEDMREFILHFAVYLGWPKASIFNVTVEKVHKEMQEAAKAAANPADAG